MTRIWILHIDMDAFYASVEQLDNPELRGKPVAVGGTSDRSVVSAASYEIRRFGVRSAMSVVQARKLCPQAIFVPGRMSRYKEISRQVMAVLDGFSPLVEQASVDEAYLDGTGLEGLFGPIEELGRAIKAGVREATGLTCSVGAAPVRFLAKIASDLDKPDGLSIIYPEAVESFLASLPVGKIPGVGKRTLDILRDLDVRTCADVLTRPESYWEGKLGKGGVQLHRRSRGVDPTGVQRPVGAKSCSAENTFHADTLDRAVLRKWLLKQSERVGADLRRYGLAGRTVTLKVKYSDFKQITRSKSLDVPTADTATIFATATELLEKLNPRIRLRLIGVGVSNFGARDRQASLLEPEAKAGTNDLDRAVDKVRERFGKNALKRADLADFD